MKFVVDRDLLVDGVNWVSKSISNRPITTALLGIVIEVADEITLSGSDLETSAKAKLKAEKKRIQDELDKLNPFKKKKKKGGGK